MGTGRRRAEIMAGMMRHAQELANGARICQTIWLSNDPLVPYYVKWFGSTKRECREGFTASPLVTVIPEGFWA